MDHCNGASAYVLRAVISAERQEIIVNVERFVKLMTGHFDNRNEKSGENISICTACEYRL